MFYKKLYRLIFTKRENLSVRWWHRLCNVLILGSTIILLITFIFLFLSSKQKWSENIYTYSFEQNYDKAKGKEQNCSFLILEHDIVSITCGEIFNASQFLTSYSKANGNYEKLQQLKKDESIDDEQIVRGGIKSGDLDSIKVKKETIILYKNLLRYVTFILIIISSWFLFWKLVFYKTIIYIIYGKDEQCYKMK